MFVLFGRFLWVFPSFSSVQCPEGHRLHVGLGPGVRGILGALRLVVCSPKEVGRNLSPRHPLSPKWHVGACASSGPSRPVSSPSLSASSAPSPLAFLFLHIASSGRLSAWSFPASWPLAPGATSPLSACPSGEWRSRHLTPTLVPSDYSNLGRVSERRCFLSLWCSNTAASTPPASDTQDRGHGFVLWLLPHRAFYKANAQVIFVCWPQTKLKNLRDGRDRIQ